VPHVTDDSAAAGLASLGWDQRWDAAWAEAAPAPGAPGARAGAGADAAEAALRPGRVVLEHGRFLRVHDGQAERLAVSSGRLRHQAASAAELPTVGDWVALAHAPGDELAHIRRVLPRRSRFSRRQSGTRDAEQVVAANIDLVLLVMGLDGDFNVRRLERYLALAHASGAAAAVVLNKRDLAADLTRQRAEVEALAGPAGGGLPVLALGLNEPGGEDPVRALLAPGKTVALLGSSGVGKSTLLNRLSGRDVQRTGGVRASDGRGKHTTSYAQLFALPGGALAIDTPGLREIQLWEAGAGVDTAFEDVAAVAAACRFGDCRHDSEPGCAVRAALADGTLARDRLDSFLKLRRELSRDPRSRPGARRRR
jgi:ribosome biogenesis GTPase